MSTAKRVTVLGLLGLAASFPTIAHAQVQMKHEESMDHSMHGYDEQAAMNIEPALDPGLEGVDFQPRTSSAEAAAYFNQGMMQIYNFNHQEAIRYFRAAQRRDPECAACYWAESFSWGPNVNEAMLPRYNKPAWESLQHALALYDKASPREQALIDALKTRYIENPPMDRRDLDRQYAEAMMETSRKFPLDNEIGILTTDAIMAMSPWNYWEADGLTPHPHIAPAFDYAEKVLARDPNHIYALHLYIHLYEASEIPGQAEAAADRLDKVRPASAGHLLHMPSHLYYRVGRFKDSIRANRDAIVADEAYLLSSELKGIYRFGYYPHNIHFLMSSAQMGGDGDTAIEHAQKVWDSTSEDFTRSMPFMQIVDAAAYTAYAQYAEADEIFALPDPGPDFPYTRIFYHYARAVTYLNQDKISKFKSEMASIQHLRDTTDWQPAIDNWLPVHALLDIVQNVSHGKLAVKEGRYEEAVAMFQTALDAEETMIYAEPPFWYHPIYVSMGAAWYKAGEYQRSADAFEGALRMYPGHPGALWGLSQAQEKLGESEEAARTMARFKNAWLGEDDWISMDRL